MRIQIDGIVHNQEFSTLAQLEEFWKSIVSKLHSSSKYIRTVSIDGTTYIYDYERSIVQQFETIKQIDIVSLTEEELLQESLSELKEYCKKVQTACDSIGSLFYSEMSEKAWEYFSKLVEAIQWVNQSISGVMQILERTQSESALLEALKETLTALEQCIRQLDAALSSKEFIAAGDIIRYELGDIITALDQKLPLGE